MKLTINNINEKDYLTFQQLIIDTVLREGRKIKQNEAFSILVKAYLDGKS